MIKMLALFFRLPLIRCNIKNNQIFNNYNKISKYNVQIYKNPHKLM